MLTNILPSALDRSQLRVAESVNSTIATVTNEHRAYWEGSLEDILAKLNADVSKTLTLFSGNTALNTALNTAQETLNVRDEFGNAVYPARAPVEMGRTDIEFNGTAWVQTFPVEPEA